MNERLCIKVSHSPTYGLFNDRFTDFVCLYADFLGIWRRERRGNTAERGYTSEKALSLPRQTIFLFFMDSNNRRGGGFGRDNYRGNRENRDSGYNRDRNNDRGFGNDRDRSFGNNDRGFGDRGGNNERGGYGDRGGNNQGGYNNRGGGYGGGNRGGFGGPQRYNDRGGFNRGGGFGGDRRNFDNREQRNNGPEERDEVHSVKIRAGKRTYFFDVKQTQADDFYITITESKRRLNGMGYEKHKIFLYKEDFNKFIEKLSEVIDHTKGLMPGVDFDAFNHSDEEKPSSELAADDDDFGDEEFDFDSDEISFKDPEEKA